MSLNREQSVYQKTAQGEIEKLVKELESEKNKLPQIVVKEKEVVKLESKCTKCNQIEFTYKLGQLKFITYGALGYSITITIISIIKNELFKSDFKAFFESTWRFLQLILKKADTGVLTLVNKVNNNILQWVMHIGLWVLIAGGVIFGLYKLVIELQYKSWKFWNIGAVGMLLIDLLLIVYLSDPIKNLIKLNLFICALGIYFTYVIMRVIINIVQIMHK